MEREKENFGFSNMLQKMFLKFKMKRLRFIRFPEKILAFKWDNYHEETIKKSK